MSTQEEMPGDTMSGLADMDSTLEKQKRQIRERNRKRALKYRRKRRQEEQNLRINYQILKANYQMVIRHNISLAVELQRLESMCRQLTTTLTQHQFNSKRRSPEYITPNIEEEGELIIDMSTNNETPTVFQEDSQSFRDKINYQAIHCEGITMNAVDWVNYLENLFSTAPNEA